MICIVAGVTALVVGLGVMLTRGRGTPFLKLELETLPAIGESLPLLAGLTESTVYDGNKAFHERLKELEIDHEYHVVDGVTHDYEKLLDGLDDKAFEIYQEQWGKSDDKDR